MKRVLLSTVLALVCLLSVYGQEKQRLPIAVRFDMRADWQQDITNDAGAFAGKYLMFVLDGKLTKDLSFHFRHRLNKMNSSTSFFEATDFAYLKWDINPNWSISGGKEIVAVGGYEYDRNPLDVYQWSQFTGSINCYEFGVSAYYTTNNQKHTFRAQLSNSPLSSRSDRFQNLYALNIAWYGNMGAWSTIYSTNLIQNTNHHVTNWIVLGNRFQLGKSAALELDLSNRYVLGQSETFGKDFSVVGNLIFNVQERTNLFVKGGFDYNQTSIEDNLVPYNKYGLVGCGVEFFPLKGNDDLRLHAFYHGTLNDHHKMNSLIAVGCKFRFRAFERK